MFQDFFKSTGTSYPLATWPTEKEKQTYETFMDLMCNQFAFICTLAELDIRQPASQRIIGRALRVKRLIVNDWVPVEQRSQAELANRSKYEDEELLDLDNRPLLQAWERYAWSSWLVERETPVIAVDWNYVDPSSTRPSTANTSSGTRPATANAVPIVVTSING
jgi:hypothetical protein